MRMGQEFQRVRRLQANWDGHGANTPCGVSVERAWRFWTALSQKGTPFPEVMATSEGGVDLEWGTPDVALVVEFEPSDDTGLFARTAGFEVDGPLGSLSREFADAVSAL